GRSRVAVPTSCSQPNSAAAAAPASASTTRSGRPSRRASPASVPIRSTSMSIHVRDEAIWPPVRELGIGFVAYSPLGRGMLTGRFQRLGDIPADDWRRSVPRWQEDNFDQNVRLVGHLDEIARRHDISTAQLALAWVLHQGEDIVPIPGTRKRENLEANAAAADVTLPADDLREIDAVVSPDRVAGARGADAYMARVNA